MIQESTELVASVVVATHERAALLPRLVKAMADQTERRIELIVVDDGSRDDTWETLTGLAASTAFPLIPLQLASNQGPALARNVGWRRARAPYIAFTDDDCVPLPNWLTVLVDFLHVADIVQGRTRPDPAQANGRGPFSRVVHVEEQDGYFETCNIAYRRSWLERLGGFDESHRFRRRPHRGGRPIYGEDTDLGWRAREHGAVAVFAPTALVYHDVSRSSYIAELRNARRAGGIPKLVRRHPGMRDLMFWRVFYLPHHAFALAAAAGIVIASIRTAPRGVRVGALLLCLPYADARTGLLADVPLARRSTHRMPLWTRRRKQLALLPLALAADLFEVAVLAGSSIPERTLLL